MATDNQGAYESVDHGGFDAAARASGAISEFLTFRLSGQEFCIDIMSVREIRGWTKATLLPHTPSYVRGVINLRGTVLPPDVAAETVKAFVQGMMALEGRMIGVINLESILPEDMEDAA